MMNILIMVGISGSGKTSFATQYLKNNTNTLRISRDDLRRTINGDLVDYYQQKSLLRKELFINHTEDFMFNLYLENNCNVIIDNTNLTQKYINRWLNRVQMHNLTKNNKYDIQFKFFDCEVSRAKLRVTHRDTPPYSLDYIDKQYNQYIDIKKWILDNHSDKIIEDGKK